MLIILTGISQITTDNTDPLSTGNETVENSEDAGNTESAENSNDIESSKSVNDSRNAIYKTCKYFLA